MTSTHLDNIPSHGWSDVHTSLKELSRLAYSATPKLVFDKLREKNPQKTDIEKK
jgi:hypothetical protein